MRDDILVVIGASDPEMEAVVSILDYCGIDITAAIYDGKRVRSDTAYKAYPISVGYSIYKEVWLIECGVEVRGCNNVITIDHHREGDAGYGKPPEEFLSASSVGQVILALAYRGLLKFPGQRMMTEEPEFVGFSLNSDNKWVVWYNGYDNEKSYGVLVVPEDYVMAAAADHCLAAAYKGMCPGVHPDDLMRWRVESRSSFQRRSAEELLADIEAAREVLRSAPELVLDSRECDIVAKDLRGIKVSELPEASAREGMCFVSDGLKGSDGRTKVVCQSGSHDQIYAFMEIWAPANGLVDVYGDPARGFAGGYIPAKL